MYTDSMLNIPQCYFVLPVNMISIKKGIYFWTDGETKEQNISNEMIITDISQ